MANPEHLEVLNQGVDVWNRWREKHPEVINPDLSNAKLDRFNLREANLAEANLRGAHLTEAFLGLADLNGADLSLAVLIGSNLDGANLRETKLRETNLHISYLRDADLTFADLREAILIGADLIGTVLNDVDFSGASIGRTTFADIDMSEVRGLENLIHTAPSSIGIDTIYRSKGKIPESFLRGVGAPENIIQYMSTLTSQAFQYYSCFISYSSKDKDFAEQLHVDLQNKGVRCWYAPEDMKIGDKIRDRIDQSIRIHDKLLLVLSEHSINSEWVEDEVESAYEQEKKRDTTVLFPIRLDDAVMDTEKAWTAKLRRSRHIGDFTNWKDHDSYQNAFDRLLRDLRAEK